MKNNDLPTITTTVRLHKVQLQFRTSSALFRGFCGGRGSGKTWVGAYDLIRRTKPEETSLAASPTGILMQDTTFPAFKKIAKDLGRWDQLGVRLSPYPTVTLSTGATIRFRTAEDPERMRGPNLSHVWLDEASLMPREAFEVSIACLREGGKQGDLSATFTPKGLTHWTYEQFGKPHPNTELFRSKTGDNPFLPPDFHQTLAEQYSGLLALQELEGQFTNVEGAEWPAEYFPESIWFNDWPTLVLRVLALDPSKGKSDKPGDDSALVEIGLDTNGHLWVDSSLDNMRPTPRIVDDGLKMYQEFKPEAFVCESNQFQELLLAEFQRVSKERNLQPRPAMYGIVNMEKKEVRIRRIGPYLCRGECHFRRTPGAERLVSQLRDFPMGEHDDGPDAMEMGMRMLWWLLGRREDKPGQPKLYG